MRSVYIVLATAVIGLAACNGSGNDAATTTRPAEKKTASSKLNEAGTSKMMEVLYKYYSLKNALVATKAEDAAAAATQLSQIADSFRTYLQTDSANGTALKPFADTIVDYSKAITGVTDKSCEQQRVSFEYVSRAMYGMLKSAQVKHGGIYHEYCPMAFNDKGAFWLSDAGEIKNPYFGKKMLECGEVADTL